ncbi:MAG: EamA family transporter [Alphaproteobacteria bacterium]|nr:EamA family transporter [Alphaproteobacteria bacterium]
MGLRDTFLAILVATLWGLGFTLAKAGLDQFPPILMMALRFTITALVLVWFVKPPWRLTGWIFLIALISGALQYSLTFNGLARLDASTAVLVVQLEVPFAALLATLFLKEHFGWRRFVGLVLAFAGVVMIGGEPKVQGNLMPVFLVMGGAFFWACGQVMVRAIGQVGGFTLIAWVAVFATPQLYVASYLFESNQIEVIRNASLEAWGVVLYLALVMTALGYGIWYHLLGKHPVNLVMPFLLLLPVLSVIFSILLLNESPTWLILGGGVVVILGVAIIESEHSAARRSRRRKAKRLTADDAAAAARAYRGALETGATEATALDTAVMVYRIANIEVSETDARTLLAGYLADGASSR